MIMHKIWNIHVYIYVMTKYIISSNIGGMINELMCACEDKNSIFFNEIFNLIVHDYNLITWYRKWL
jgi:hypothetical protein